MPVKQDSGTSLSVFHTIPTSAPSFLHVSSLHVGGRGGGGLVVCLVDSFSTIIIVFVLNVSVLESERLWTVQYENSLVNE